jgi:hypothetical protein
MMKDINLTVEGFLAPRGSNLDETVNSKEKYDKGSFSLALVTFMISSTMSYAAEHF